MDDDILSRTPVTRSQLVEGLRELGVRPASIVMVHCRLSSFGYVVGGLETLVHSLRDVVGPDGTLMALAGWEHDSYDLEDRNEAARRAYLDDPPIFDSDISEAARDFGRLAERIRTWPGARRSNHPEASFAAVGARAEWLTADTPWHHPYGPESSLERLVEAEGDVVMLGAPLETLTLLHYAEELSRVPNKKLVRYKAPVRGDAGLEWREIDDIDTSIGALPYQNVVGGKDAFQVIGEEAVAAGISRHHGLGTAELHLFPARALVDFAVAWMERHFA